MCKECQVRTHAPQRSAALTEIWSPGPDAPVHLVWLHVLCEPFSLDGLAPVRRSSGPNRVRERQQGHGHRQDAGAACVHPPICARAGPSTSTWNTSLVAGSDDSPPNRMPTRRGFSASWLQASVVEIGMTRTATSGHTTAAPRNPNESPAASFDARRSRLSHPTVKEMLRCTQRERLWGIWGNDGSASRHGRVPSGGVLAGGRRCRVACSYPYTILINVGSLHARPRT
jgi:hypothetical protein